MPCRPWAATALVALALALVLVRTSSAHAQSMEPRWLVDELAWAAQAQRHAPFIAMASPFALRSVAALKDATTAAHRATEADPALRRERGRYRTMKVAGYTLAVSTLVVSLAFMPMFLNRQDHVDHYGEQGCGPNAVPYVAPTLIAAGLAVGIVGSVRARRFTSTHGAIPGARTPWRVALAGTGVGFALSGLFAFIGVANVCNS